MAPPIPLDRANDLIKDGRPHSSCCGVALGEEHIPECMHFKAVRPMSEQCRVCNMIGFHHADCTERGEATAENPKHYEHPSGVETIRVNRCMTFTAGSAFKYMLRYEAKFDPPEDLRKARWYLADIEAYADPIWISPIHRSTGANLLQEMIWSETNDFRRRFFRAVLDDDLSAMAQAVEDARCSVR